MNRNQTRDKLFISLCRCWELILMLMRAFVFKKNLIRDGEAETKLDSHKNVPQVDPTRHRWMLEVRRSLLNVSIAWVMLLITSVCSSHHHHQAFGVLDKRPQRSLIPLVVQAPIKKQSQGCK